MQENIADLGEALEPESELQELPREAFYGKTNKNSFKLKIGFNDENYQIYCPVCGGFRFECWETAEFELLESDSRKEFVYSQKAVNVICIGCKIKISAVKPKGNGDGVYIRETFNDPYARAGEKGPKLVIELHYLFCPICGSRKFSQKMDKSLLACAKGHPMGYKLLNKKKFH